MTASSTPSDPAPKDSEPAPLPSQPPGGALWGDSDIAAVREPSPAFATNVKNQPDDQIPTIGHIGRYALKYQLGEGGLGTVFAAHDPLLSRLIAVKTLNVELEVSERDSFNAMFLNEARAAAGLSHPHIVTVFDAGISDNRVYIAMELLKGRDLRQLRQEGWRATPAQAALIVRRVADALAYAHSKGVVHRDVKPANIFMVGRTQPRVLDFGIARIAHQHENAAGGEVAAGSPYYMAPEQSRNETVDRRADVFSLGVVLYELLTDQKPFRGNTLDEITNAVRKHEPPLANKIDPNIPEALAMITARAIEKNPEHRYRSARAFSRELRHWLDENTVSTDNEGDAPAPAAKKRWLWGAVAAAGVLAIGAAIAIGVSRHPATAEVAAGPATTAAANSGATAPEAAAATTTPGPGSANALVGAGATGTPGAAVAATTTAVTTAALTPAANAAPMTGTVPPAESLAAPAAGTPAPVVAQAKPADKTAKPTGKDTPKETAKERRAREAREREAKAAAAAAPAPTGTLRIAVSPWGQVEVDGKPAGTSPPLTELSLPEGKHQVVIRNSDLPPYSTSVSVTAGQTATLKYKF